VVRQSAPRLVDVLLRDDVMVFEPLWTLIPSNKAILAVLWSLFPDCPYLLESQLSLTDGLGAKGYVAKPIAGRCGSNVSLVDRDSTVLDKTAGRFQHQDQMFQELWPLPSFEGQFVQMCTLHG